MNVKVIKEEPIIEFSYWKCDDCGDGRVCENGIRLFRSDLEGAKVGTEWKGSMVDRCQNTRYRWTLTVKVVYRDETGLALLSQHEQRWDDPPRLYWVELHAESD